MRKTVNKFLFYGAVAIEVLSLPLGIMSKEVKETSKFVSGDVSEHTEKRTLILIFYDLVHKILFTSYRFISPTQFQNFKSLKDPILDF